MIVPPSTPDCFSPLDGAIDALKAGRLVMVVDASLRTHWKEDATMNEIKRVFLIINYFSLKNVCCREC